jgi:hypothetical protein
MLFLDIPATTAFALSATLESLKGVHNGRASRNFYTWHQTFPTQDSRSSGAELFIAVARCDSRRRAVRRSGGASGGPGTPGYTPPPGGYGSGKAIGIGVGAAAGVGVLFLALHNHGNVSGCVQPTDDGLRLVDEKKNKTYALVPGAVILKPGQRVELKGQKSKSEAGAQSFEAKKLVRDLGSCTASTPVAQAQPAGR